MTDDLMIRHELRDACIKRGLWTLLAQDWVDKLAERIGDGTVLEIMAGGGWLAKALSNAGVEVIATDDGSWNDKHTKMKPLVSIEWISAIVAVKKIKADALLVSWPPYGKHHIVETAKAWEGDRPIIYIGEDEGGCNAPDEFFVYFENTETMDIPQHWGLHDFVQIGYWKGA